MPDEMACEMDTLVDTTDICEIDDEKAIISCLKQRFQNEKIYVSISGLNKLINGVYS